MAAEFLKFFGGSRFGLVAVIMIVLAITLDIVSLSLTQWMVGYGYSYGLFRVCANNVSHCVDYGPNVLWFNSTVIENFYFNGIRTATAMLLLVLFLLVAAIVFIVLSGIQRKKTLLLVACFICIQSVTFNGIGVGMYHVAAFRIIQWTDPGPSVGAGFAVACLLPVIYFPAAVLLFVAYRSFPNH